MTNNEQPEQQGNEPKCLTEPAVGDIVGFDERTGRNIVRTLGYSAAVHSSFESEDLQQIIVPYLAN